MFSELVPSNLRSNGSSWNALFSSLALAEKAAANECLKLAQKFKSNGFNHLAAKYEELAVEENRHHELALSVVQEHVPLTKCAQTVYDGGFFSADGSILERLMSVHFVFEPSALAFLGYVSRNAHELMDDQEWAVQIKNVFNEILWDEVRHVQEGGEIIQKFWDSSSDDEKRIALKTMRKHRAFLKAGLKSFFSGSDIEKHFVSKMLERFDRFYKRATEGVLHADTA